jgi:hypothetical protein
MISRIPALIAITQRHHRARRRSRTGREGRWKFRDSLVIVVLLRFMVRFSRQSGIELIELWDYVNILPATA